MTDAELDAIEERMWQSAATSARDVPVLVAEVKRLREGLQFVREELLNTQERAWNR